MDTNPNSPALIVALCILAVAANAPATLPPPSEEAKARAAEAKAKAAWSDKVDQYKLCVAINRTAETYHAGHKENGASTSGPVTTPGCVDPGPYVSQMTPAASKPVEASDAHSPSGTAAALPSIPATQAQISESAKP
jgi:hypothetical protein